MVTATKKPIVFFSHSTQDKYFLEKIRELLLTKTGNSIDIFMSSDGQSIPFGKNWVSTIESNLRKSSLCFAFLSINSMKSNWLHFEAGFIYANKTYVVPIGIQGLDFTKLEPPISLLQGFNLFDENGLNNILSIINKTYEFEFPLDFDKNDFQQLERAISPILNNWQSLSKLIASYSNLIELRSTNKNPIEIINQVINNNDIEHTYDEIDTSFVWKSYGIKLHVLKNSNRYNLHISIATSSFHNYLDLLKELNSKLLGDFSKLNINFKPGSKVITSEIELTSRLNKSKVRLGQGSYYKYLDYEFKFSSASFRSPVKLTIIYENRNFKSNKFLELVNELINKNIIYFS